jgi:hypothetical protein
MKCTELIGTIEKVRYSAAKGRFFVKYSVEGSSKTYEHTMAYNCKPHFWRNGEIVHLYNSFLPHFRSVGDGCRSKVLYDRTKDGKTLKFEILYFEDGHLSLNRIRKI